MRKAIKRMYGRDKKGQKGFTLIELLIVIGILAIVAAVAIPNLTKFMGSGKAESWESDQNSIATAVQGYYMGGHGTGGASDYPIGATGGAAGGAIDFSDDLDAGERAFVINFTLLVTQGYLTEVPASACDDHTTGTGSYCWYMDANENVQGRQQLTGTTYHTSNGYNSVYP